MKKFLKYLFTPLLNLYLIVIHFFKSIAVEEANKAIKLATEISKYRLENLALYGEQYSKTMEFARLEFAERFALFKYKLYKELFRF